MSFNRIVIGWFALAALSALSACDSGGGPVDLRVHIQRADVQRCGALQSFTITLSVENRGGSALTLDKLTLAGEDDLVTGATPFEADSASVAVGATAIYTCVGGVETAWPSDDPSALYSIVATVREERGYKEAAEGALRFFELFDNCNTAFPEPHGCRLVR